MYIQVFQKDVFLHSAQGLIIRAKHSQQFRHRVISEIMSNFIDLNKWNFTSDWKFFEFWSFWSFDFIGQNRMFYPKTLQTKEFSAINFSRFVNFRDF